MGTGPNKDQFIKNAARFNYPEGRYNYYPRITSWQNNLEEKKWFLEISNQEMSEVDIYIHIPFCARFCFFCGCNIKATDSQTLINQYIENLIHEWEQYKKYNFKVANIYFGGGTPNSISDEHFLKILNLFESGYKLHIEYDPRFHNPNLLSLLKTKGLTSISMGIQDLDQNVLQNIGRPTNLNDVKLCLADLERLQIEHIAIDIIYGLPNQGKNSFDLISTFLKEHPIITGISLYPFAEVPWFKEYNPNWKKSENHAQEKSLQFFNFSTIFYENDYELVSFGHYLKKNSPLEKCYQNNALKRSIMGFSSQKSDTLIGLGVSAISQTRGAIKQNHKIFENYMKWPTTIYTGHFKSDQEKVKEATYLEISAKKELHFRHEKIVETMMESNHLERLPNNSYSLTTLGKHFIQYNIQLISTAYSI